jgi:hypothetical protein
MSDILVFVCGDAEKYAAMAEPMRELGWETAMVDPAFATALETIEATAPVATVFDLAAGPEQVVHELAKAMLGDPDLPRPLLVFVGGTNELAERIKSDVPFGVFVAADELTWVLKHLVYKD